MMSNMEIVVPLICILAIVFGGAFLVTIGFVAFGEPDTTTGNQSHDFDDIVGDEQNKQHKAG